ncbi:hypothetical protein RRG08_042718 [Elysia crispata]|uniref:Apple domain-containing protein n=1 Tax=Elysia crispata TaxID=231223 RepID=A0AAE0XQK6_9GAST|nr:hypothetical protein RRG08_042718 [Elysia crispata]
MYYHFLACIAAFCVLGVVKGSTLITRPGTSSGDCARLCVMEQDIDCRYYKFKKAKSMCILTPTLDPNVNGLVKVDKPEPASNSQPASTWLAQIQARILALEQRNIDIKSLHKNIVELKAEVMGLKNSRALTHHLLRTTKEQEDQNVQALDQKVEVLKAESKRVEDAVMTLGDLEKTLGNKVRKNNEEQRESGLTMAMLSQTTKDERTSLRELAQSISTIKSDVQAVRKAVTELEVRFAGLTTDVMEKVSNFDAMVGPELKEFRNSQATLGEALGMLTKKIMKMAPLIPALERKFDQKLATLVELEKEAVNMKEQLVFVNNRLGFTEKELKANLDPMSKENVERRAMLTDLRKEVVVTQNHQHKIDEDIQAEAAARHALFKQIADLRVSRRAVVDKVVLVEKGIGNLREELHKVATDGPNGRLMSNLLKRQVAVLKSLKALRNTQGQVQAALNAYKVNMLKTHRLLLDKDQRRIREEVALGQLKSKLVKVYVKMKSMADRVPPAVMAALVDQQKRTLSRVQQIRRDQADLRRRLGSFASTVMSARAHMKQSLMHEKADKAVLDSLSVRVARLNNRFNKLGKIPPGKIWLEQLPLTSKSTKVATAINTRANDAAARVGGERSSQCDEAEHRTDQPPQQHSRRLGPTICHPSPEVMMINYWIKPGASTRQPADNALKL